MGYFFKKFAGHWAKAFQGYTVHLANKHLALSLVPESST